VDEPTWLPCGGNVQGGLKGRELWNCTHLNRAHAMDKYDWIVTAFALLFLLALAMVTWIVLDLPPVR
jgi:hypothetical protein